MKTIKERQKGLQIELNQSKINLNLAIKAYFDFVCKQSTLSNILSAVLKDDLNLKKEWSVKNSYYVGGTLCIDLNYDILIMLNLDETVSFIWKDITVMRNLDITNTVFIYQIYKKYRGITDYFKENLCESFLYDYLHIKNDLMKWNNNTLEFIKLK